MVLDALGIHFGLGRADSNLDQKPDDVLVSGKARTGDACADGSEMDNLARMNANQIFLLEARKSLRYRWLCDPEGFH